MTIQLTDKISKYFTWKELLYLPTWKEYHTPSTVEQNNLIKLAKVMDDIRDIIGKPIRVHVCIRPGKANIPGSVHNGQDYNALIGGAKNSAHKSGLAIDWSVPGEDCDDIRTLLLPILTQLGVRMEDKPNSNWVHIDLLPPRPNRFFKP